MLPNQFGLNGIVAKVKPVIHGLQHLPPVARHALGGRIRQLRCVYLEPRECAPEWCG